MSVPKNTQIEHIEHKIKSENFQLPDFFLKLKNKIFSTNSLTAKNTIKWVKEFCNARIHHLQVICELLESKENAEVKEYFKKVLGLQLTDNNIMRKENKETTKDLIKYYHYLLSTFENTENTENTRINAAYLNIYVAHMQSLRRAGKNYNKKNLIHKKRKSEAPFLEEILNSLRPHVSKYLHIYTKYISIGNDDVPYMLDYPAIVNDTKNELSKINTRIGEIVSRGLTVPTQYINGEFKKKYFSLQKSFNDNLDRLTNLEDKIKGTLELKVIEKLSQEFCKIKADFSQIIEDFQFNFQRFNIMNDKILNVKKMHKKILEEMEQKLKLIKLDDFSQVQQEEFYNIKQEFSLRISQFVQLETIRSEQIADGFTGDNLTEVEEKIDTIINYIQEVFTKEQELYSISIMEKTNVYKLIKEQKEKDLKKIEEENIALVEKFQSDYRARRQAHRDEVDKLRKEKEDLRIQKAMLKRTHILQLKLQEEISQKKQEDEAAMLSQELNEAVLNSDNRLLLDDIFSEHPPHYKISYHAIKNLICSVFKGDVLSNKGSHQKMRIQVINLKNNLCMIDDPENEDIHSIIYSGPLVKPHIAGHNPDLLPRYSVKEVCAFLKRVGLIWPPKPPFKMSLK